ncbi:MAG TPA: leucyl/phenylalanyl-tRNA--protein transferase [Phycisphaerales bacterium]|nr:leucyl/phenylalanyl-tRNA--protein transferase [Phycisphaerales bacterium]
MNTVTEDSLVAITPVVVASDLEKAYAQGLFPWSGRPAHWFCPHPRAVFELEKIHFPRRLLRLVRKKSFHITYDTAFERVMRRCQEHHRECWIDDDIVRAFCDFHAMGYAHSVEVWQDGDLVGGLYGVHMGRMYAGESMFGRVSNASKVAFYHLVKKLESLEVELMDAQVLNPNTERFDDLSVSRVGFHGKRDKKSFPYRKLQEWGL